MSFSLWAKRRSGTNSSTEWSPGPIPDHSELANEIVFQLIGFARGGGGVRVFADVDVRLASGKVYRPDGQTAAGRMFEASTEQDRVVSSALPGFVLDLAPIRRIVESR